MAKDKIEILNERLKEVSEKFRVLKESGIDEEILEIYLERKTKLSKGKIRDVIHHTEEFYKKLIKNTMLEKLK